MRQSMSSIIEAQLPNNSNFSSSDDKIKEELNKAIDVLSKASPSSNEISTYNKIVIERLKQFRTVHILFSLLLNAEGDKVRCSLILNFISYYLKSQVKPGIGILRHDKNEIYNKVKSMFFCYTLSDKHKRVLQTCFANYLSSLSTQFLKMRKALCQQIVDFYTNHQNPSDTDLGNSLYLIESALTSTLQADNLRLLQQKLLLNFVILSLKLARQLDQLLTQTTIFTQQQKYMISWALKVLKITQLLFRYASPDKVFVLKLNVIVSNELAQYLILSIRLSKNHEHFMLAEHQCASFKAVNQIKLSALYILKNSIIFLNKANKNLAEPKYIPVTQTIKIFLSDIIPKLANEIGQFPNKDVASQTNFRQALQILCAIAKIPCFLNQLTQMRDLILLKICFPCFITSPQDQELRAEDYCNKRQRIVNHNEIANVQQAAAQLMQAYFDNIYGTIPYMVKTVINLMEFQLTANQQYYQQIPTMISDSNFFTTFSYFQQMQASLGVMALLSYQAESRDDISIPFEAFIVRRQSFFSKTDLSPQVIISFFHCCAYYISNFYVLIMKGKANPDFHRSLIFHSLQLIKLNFNQKTHDYNDNNAKKIGIQAMDYISNVLIQQNLFSTVFPANNPHYTSLFCTLISSVCLFLNSSFNYNLIENVLIDFLTKFIQQHSSSNMNDFPMPSQLRNQVSALIAEHIVANFQPNLKNDTLAKQKLMQLYQLCIVISQNPTQLLKIGDKLFNHIADAEYTYIEECLDVIQVYISRAIKQQFSIPTQLQQTILKCVIKTMNVCSSEKLERQVFDVIMNLNILKLLQQSLCINLLQVFEEKVKQKDKDEKAQIVIQKVLYLIMQIAFSNFELVSAVTWVKVLQKMIQYMKQHYVPKETITIGKATCICLCCYFQDPQGVQNYLGTRTEGLWDCILDDQSKYSSVTQKKVMCILLQKFIIQYCSRPIIKERFPAILKTICIVIYNNYERIQIQSEESDDNDDDIEADDSEQDKLEKRCEKWRSPMHKISENPFLLSLPDERMALKQICQQLNTSNHQNFIKFVSTLPIALQNLIKNKIIMYRNDLQTQKHKKLRTILKIKQPSQSE